MLPFLERKNTDLFLYSFSNFGFPAHFHDSMEIVCVESGEIVLITDGQRYPVHGGEIAVVFPGQIHCYEPGTDGKNSGFLLLLGQRLISEYKSELKGFTPKHPVFTLNSLSGDCGRAIEALRLSSGRDFREQKAYAMVFLCRFLPAAKLCPAKPTGESTLYPLITYMEQHFRESISLDDAADALYMSRYRLSRIFSHLLGTSFNDYLNSLRVNLAIQLLDTTDSSVTDIAYEVGFGNMRTFNRAFKKHRGITPTQFRSGQG